MQIGLICCLNLQRKIQVANNKDCYVDDMKSWRWKTGFRQCFFAQTILLIPLLQAEGYSEG